MASNLDLKVPEGMIGFAEAAELVGVTVQAIHRWRRVGRICAIEHAGQWWTTPREVRRAFEDVPRIPGRPKRGKPRAELFQEELATA